MDISEEVKVINDENDMYGTTDKAQSIVEFIQLDENKDLLSKNNLIAIYGEWGTGKSSLMKTIEEKLENQDYKTLWFDTWKNEKDKNLPYSLFRFILKDSKESIIKTLGEKYQSFMKTSYMIFKSMVSGINMNMKLPENENGGIEINFSPGDVLASAEQSVEEINKEEAQSKCYWQNLNEFENDFSKINFGNKKMVVFLDDLDRCESENIINVLSAVKLLLSCNPNIIFIIGIDKEAVSLALTNKYNNNLNKANEYLEKVFPINFSISSKFRINKFIEYITETTGLSRSDSEKIFDFIKKLKFKNPRQLKKIFRKYYTIKNSLLHNAIDIDNVNVVTYILYFIILNCFYEDEYHYLINENKEKLYNDIKLQYKSNNKDVIEFDYNKVNKVLFKKVNERNINIFKLIELLSPSKLKRNNIQCIPAYKKNVIVSINDWLPLFQNGLCTDFIEFICDDDEMLNIFFEINGEEEVCNIDKIKKIIQKIDLLM